MFKPSKYQQTVYTYIQKGSGNAVVSAVAGSGKSTTIVNALKLIPQDKNVLFLAFNKSIVDELQKKIGDLPNVEVSTLHSLGMRAIRKRMSVNIFGGKCSKYINERLENGTIQSENYDKLSPIEQFSWKKNVLSLVDLARVNLMCDEKSLIGLVEKHGLDLVDNEIKAALDVIQWDKNNIGEIDFTDMIYFPIIMNIDMPQYDWVFIDECQDLNAAQRNLFLKCVKPGGRFIAVGDEKQSIYGFCGADAGSFNLLRNTPHTAKLPLSICYRCDQNISKLAQSIVPQIQWRDGADEGEVNYEASIDEILDGDMVLCRITAPLVCLCMKFISQNKKAYVKGRDVGANLCRMIENTKAETIEYALEVMNRDLDKIIGKLLAYKMVSTQQEAMEHPSYVYAKDRVESIQAISEGLEKSSDVIEKIKSIFSDNNGNGICLSSVHKSKGLENDRVFILCPDKLPLKGCMKIPWMAEQEMNLKYVAYTRAKHYLGFIIDFKQ